MIKTRHMFSFKDIIICLPFFWLLLFLENFACLLLGSTQCWLSHWKIQNLVSCLNFSSLSECQLWAGCRSCLSHEVWQSLLEKERAGRPLSPDVMCTWLSHPSAGHAGWHKVGGQEETPSLNSRQESCDSFLQSRKAAKTQQGVTAAQNLRTGLCKIPQPCELVSSDFQKQG